MTPASATSRYAMIVTNYKRPANISRILASCEQSKHVPDIYLIDNSDCCSGRAAADGNTRVRYLPQPRNQGSAYRFILSSTLPHDCFICIDDDMFLQPGQADALFDRIEAHPHGLHGVWGQIFLATDIGFRLKSGIKYRDCKLPIINRVYGYASCYIRDAVDYACALGYSDWQAAGPVDDILLSLTGHNPPTCHDLGPLEDCPSSDDPLIAVWQTEGFADSRIQLVHALLPAVRWPIDEFLPSKERA